MLIGTSLVISFSAMLAPDDKTSGGTYAYVKFIASLCVLCVVISPLSSFVRNIASGELIEDVFYKTEDVYGEEYEGVYDKTLMAAGGESVAAGLSSLLCRELGVNADELSVYVELYEGEGEYLVKAVTVTLKKSAVLCDPQRIREIIEELCGCVCEIVYL